MTGAQLVKYQAAFHEESDDHTDAVGLLNGGSLRNVPLRLDRDD